MKILSRKPKNEQVVGLEFDVGSVAAAEPTPGGVGRAGVQPLPAGAVRDGEVTDAGAVASALAELFGREKLSKTVRLGVANQHVALRTVRLPPVEDPKQLKSAIRFLAQEQIPMPLESAVLDHQIIGASTTEDGARRIEVAVVAARKETVESLLTPVRDAGLEPVGVDLTAFGMIRALAAPSPAGEGGLVQGTLYCGLGDVTNLAIARDSACLFARVAEFGMRQVSERLVSERGLLPEHADQWLIHVGLEAEPETIAGDPEIVATARQALLDGSLRLADELRLSIDSYGAAEEALPVGKLVLCGWGAAIPGLATRLGEELSRDVEARHPAALGELPAGLADRLTVPYGLGLGE